jgi:hypothetical protein
MSPSARFGATMSYDPATGNMVLYGGDANGVYVGDTWTWNGTTWAELSPATSPPARPLRGHDGVRPGLRRHGPLRWAER